MVELELEEDVNPISIGKVEKGVNSVDSTVVVEDSRSNDSNEETTTFRRCTSSVSLWTMVPTVSIACLMSLLGGTTLSYSSSTLLELKELPNPRFRFHSALLSDIFGASAMIGSIFGGPTAGILADKWGRKASLVLNVLPYLVGYFTVLTTYLIQEPTVFKVVVILGRGITGMGLGWSFTIVPIYIGEITPAKVRGIFVSIADIFVSFGVLSSYGLGTIPGLHYYDTALAFVVIMAVYIVAVMWLPETPRWLLLKRNDRKQASAVMRCFSGPNSTKGIIEELDSIQSTISRKHLGVRRILHLMFCNKSTTVPFLLSVFVCAYHQLNGVGVVTTYTGYILQKAGVPDPRLTSLYAAGLAFLAARILTGFLVEVVGRKSLLAIGSAGMCIGAIILGVQFYIMRGLPCSQAGSSLSCDSDLYPMAISGVAIFSLGFGIGAGPVTWILLSEYLPLEIKGVAGGICVLFNRGAAAILTGTYVNYSDAAGAWFPWWTIASLNLVGFVVILLFVRETKGKTLEEVQQLFQGKVIQIPCWK